MHHDFAYNYVLPFQEKDQYKNDYYQLIAIHSRYSFRCKPSDGNVLILLPEFLLDIVSDVNPAMVTF